MPRKLFSGGGVNKTSDLGNTKATCLPLRGSKTGPRSSYALSSLDILHLTTSGVQIDHEGHKLLSFWWTITSLASRIVIESAIRQEACLYRLLSVRLGHHGSAEAEWARSNLRPGFYITCCHSNALASQLSSISIGYRHKGDN